MKRQVANMARKVFLSRRKSSDCEKVPLVPNEHSSEELNPEKVKAGVKAESASVTKGDHKIVLPDVVPDNHIQNPPAFSMKLTKEERRRLECVLIEINLREYNF